MSTPNNQHPLARRAREMADGLRGEVMSGPARQLLLDLAAEVERSREKENAAYRRGQEVALVWVLEYMDYPQGTFLNDYRIRDLPPEGE